MECSAIPYSIEDLDSGDEKEHAWGQHSGDLVDKGLTQVHIQQRQYGLGCIDSWMTKPMEIPHALWRPRIPLRHQGKVVLT